MRAGRRISRWLRFAWTTLTSMRTALILLLLLAIAAVPGSMLPQRPTNPAGVASFLAANPNWAWLDRLGAFDVFGTAWFAAIYLLLTISLIGCILPRGLTYLAALRQPPAPAPSSLDRLPGHRVATLGGANPGIVLEAASAKLRKSGYRVQVSADSVSAERGYLREAGNLVFHICLLVALVGLAWGALFSFRGTAIVVEGGTFANNLTQYDEFSAGAGFKPDQLVPFRLDLNQFEVRFETGQVQRGAARDFAAQVYLTSPGEPARRSVVEVNAPLQVAGNTIHLLGHGYAPVVTVRDGDGKVALAGPVVFLPMDANFASDGVINAPDAREERLAFEGLFLPTAAPGETGMVSVFPDAINPHLLVNAWFGPPQPESGVPQNIFVLDKTGLTQLVGPDQKPIRADLAVGERFELPQGRGSITFDGWRRWTRFQVSNSPGGLLVLISVMIGVLAMAVSLSVKPRRLFLRVHQQDTGQAQLQVSAAGLDRASGRAGLDDEVADLVASLPIRLAGL